MRALVFLLVLANLLFFAYTQGYFGMPPSPDAARLAQQVNPERIRIVARGEPPPAPATVPAPVEACLAWSGLAAAEADRLTQALGERLPAAKLQRRGENAAATAWWVLIPPLPGKAEVERKVAELKHFGVTDFFVIQEAGPNRLAISLGLFSTEAAANVQLEGLRSKGVRSARVRPKNSGEALLTLEVRAPAKDLEAVRGLLGERSPGECNGAAPAASAP